MTDLKRTSANPAGRSCNANAGKASAMTCRNGGFTLLEVMVAMLLLAVIMAASVTMLFINIKGWEGLSAHSEATLEEHLIEKRLRSMIHHLVPLVWRDLKQPQLALNGDNRELHFLSKAPRQHGAGGLFEYLLVEEGTPEQGSSLVLYYAPMDPNASELTLPESGARRVLVSGLESVRFSYYGSKRDREASEWHSSWEANSTHYPDLIKLTLGYAADEEKTRESYFSIHQNHPVIVQRKQ